MKELAKRNPDLVKLVTLPHRTLEGRAVRALEISKDVAARDGKPLPPAPTHDELRLDYKDPYARAGGGAPIGGND